MTRQTWAIILAAGQGSRLSAASGGIPKQFLPLHERPLYWESVRTFSRCARLSGLVLVFPAEQLERAGSEVTDLMHRDKIVMPWRVVSGGERRQDSVRNGLQALPPECGCVLVHDAARPFASAGLVNRVLDALAGGTGPDGTGPDGTGPAGVVPGIPVTDTIKLVSGERVERTLERGRLLAVQTPQGFVRKALQTAHARAVEEGWQATDDASLLEQAGFPVQVVEGEAANLKITRPEDLALLQEQASWEPCVGYGYDVHRFAPAESAAAECAVTGSENAVRKGGGRKTQPARPLRLGGVAIPGGPCVLAHSDGDVLLHALVDALLGCIGGGDIGQLFPDNDPALDNVSSAVMLDEVLGRVRAAGVRPVQADLTIVAQIPKIGPHRETIRRNVARLMGLELSRVNLKATTEEGLGFTGEKRGLKAVAVVAAQRPGRKACVC